MRSATASGCWTVLPILAVCCVCAGLVFGLGAHELASNRVVLRVNARVLDDGVLDQADIDRLTPFAAPHATLPDPLVLCADHLAALNRLDNLILSQTAPDAVEITMTPSPPRPTTCTVSLPERSAAAGISILVAVVIAGVLPLVGVGGYIVFRSIGLGALAICKQRWEAGCIVALVSLLAWVVAGQFRFELQNMVLYVIVAVGLFWPVLILRAAATLDSRILLADESFENRLGQNRMIDDAVRLMVLVLALAFSLAVAFVAALNARYVAQYSRLTLDVLGAEFGGLRSHDLPLVNAVESVVFAAVLIVLCAPALFAGRQRAHALMDHLRVGNPETANESIQRVLRIDEQATTLGLAWRTSQILESGLAMLAPILTGAASQLLGFG